MQNDPTGATVGLSTLNVNNSITVQVDFCATDGVNQCAEKQTIVIPLETVCPNDIAASGITEDSVIVTFTNVLGAGVTYKIDIVDLTTSAIAATTIIDIQLKHSQMRLLNIIHQQGKVMACDYKEDAIYLKAKLPILTAKKVLTEI